MDINVSSDNTEFASVDGILYDKSLTELVIFPAGRGKCELQETVTSIRSFAFYGCSKLTLLPELKNIKIIPWNAFVGCNNLISIIIPENIIKIEDYAFSECSNLQEVEIKNGVVSIGEKTFSNCNNLKKVLIHDSVYDISNRCFSGCYGLTIYANPDSYARKYANENNIKFSCMNHANIVTDNAIPATCTNNGKTAGSHCADCGTIISGCEIIPKQHDIVYINIPSTCTTEGRKYAYCKVCNATGDENGEFSDNSSYSPSGHKFNKGIITKQPTALNTGIKTFTCIVCGETKTAQISKLKPPKKGKVLKSSDNFYRVTKSGSVNGTVEFVISDSKKSSIIIPNTVTIDGITYKVTSIGKNSFKTFTNKKKLKKITIGSNITTIKMNAFIGCKNLKTIIIKSKNIKFVGKNSFKGIKSNASIKVPSVMLKEYKELFKNKGQKSTVKITIN